MEPQDYLSWPQSFEKNMVDFFNEPPKAVLAMQLVAWQNVILGLRPPPNFFEVMDAASKVTGAFTPDQCMNSTVIRINRSSEED